MNNIIVARPSCYLIRFSDLMQYIEFYNSVVNGIIQEQSSISVIW